MRPLAAIVALLAAVLLGSLPEPAGSLGNDLIANAVVVSTSPAVFDFDTSNYNAQPDPNDPEVECGSASAGLKQQSHTAWFTFTPITPGSFRASTAGSDGVDTVLALWTASGNNVGTLIYCNEVVASTANPRPTHAQIPAADSHEPPALVAGQKYYLEVMSYGATPGGPVRLSVDYSGLLAEHPVPIVTSIGPGGAPVGASTTSLAIAGSGFVAGAKVQFGATELTPSAIAGDELTVNLPANLLAAEANFEVTVTNPAPGGGVSGALTFVIYPAPSVVAMEPQNVLLGSGAVTVFLVGAGFRDGISSAMLAGQLRALTVTSSTTAEVAILASDSLVAGQLSLVVTNQAGGGEPAASAPRPLLVRSPFDTNCSGDIGASDAHHLLRVMAGLSQVLPGCPLGIAEDALLAAVLEIRRTVAGLE